MTVPEVAESYGVAVGTIRSPSSHRATLTPRLGKSIADLDWQAESGKDASELRIRPS
jgi:hypothetical protein